MMFCYVRKITLMKSTNNQDQDRTIPYELPAQFGTSHIPGSRKAHANLVFEEVIQTVNYVLF